MQAAALQPTPGVQRQTDTRDPLYRTDGNLPPSSHRVFTLGRFCSTGILGWVLAKSSRGAGAARRSGASLPSRRPRERGDKQARLTSPAHITPYRQAECASSVSWSDVHSATACWKEQGFRVLLQEGAAGGLPALAQGFLPGTSSGEELLLLLWKCPDHPGPGAACLGLTLAANPDRLRVSEQRPHHWCFWSPQRRPSCTSHLAAPFPLLSYSLAGTEKCFDHLLIRFVYFKLQRIYFLASSV